MPDERQKEMLLEAAQAAVKDVRERASARSSRTSTRASQIAVTTSGVMLLGLGLYLVTARPAWFFTPPPPPEPVPIQEASLRLTLVREAARVRQFQRANGRLPARLSEAGSPVEMVSYQVDDGVFTLSVPFGESRLALSSTDSVSVFLGKSVGLITGRGRE
jgi:hypothetical protein